MPKLILALMLLTLTVVLINLTSPCFAHQQPITEVIFNSTSKRFNFCQIGNVNQCKYKMGKALMARDDAPEPPPK